MTNDPNLRQRITANQQRLAANLSDSYDFVVCGAGASGSVVARRLAEDPGASVLLLEAGGSDDVPSVTEAAQWSTNLGGERDWSFLAEPNPNYNGRALVLPMGKVLGGSTSINVMTWVRGHQTDWDHFAEESANDAWNYDSVRKIYARVEDWHGTGDRRLRGSGGAVYISRADSTHPAGPAVLEAAGVLGIKRFDHPNGEIMESSGGVAIADNCIRDGKRQSIFRAYTYPVMDRPNLTVLTGAAVHRVVIENARAVGVEVALHGSVRRFAAGAEVILAMGAMNTPKVLMLSGIGDESSLRGMGIPVVQHLPGVGKNFQNHTAFSCIWETPDYGSREAVGAALMFWPTRSGLDAPDLFAAHAPFPLATDEVIARFGAPDSAWTMFGAATRPRSRGTVELASTDPDKPVRIAENGLSHPDDVTWAVECIRDMREVGNSVGMRPFLRREVMPGDLKGDELSRYLREAATSFFHHVGTAKMGRDPLSVVDGSLRVYGIERLRVADGSVMPQITVGNTMAPCVVIGERAAEEMKAHHSLAAEKASV